MEGHFLTVEIQITDFPSCRGIPPTSDSLEKETALQFAEIEARTILEVKNPQLIFQFYWLMIDQPIHKILHSDWLN